MVERRQLLHSYQLITESLRVANYNYIPTHISMVSLVAIAMLYLICSTVAKHKALNKQSGI